MPGFDSHRAREEVRAQLFGADAAETGHALHKTPFRVDALTGKG